MSEPLIHTSQGNLPVSDLILEVEWENALGAKVIPEMVDGKLGFSAQLVGNIVCKPSYYVKRQDGSRGDLVRSDAYVFHTGLGAEASQGGLG